MSTRCYLLAAYDFHTTTCTFKVVWQNVRLSFRVCADVVVIRQCCKEYIFRNWGSLPISSTCTSFFKQACLNSCSLLTCFSMFCSVVLLLPKVYFHYYRYIHVLEHLHVHVSCILSSRRTLWISACTSLPVALVSHYLLTENNNNYY